MEGKLSEVMDLMGSDGSWDKGSGMASRRDSAALRLLMPAMLLLVLLSSSAYAADLSCSIKTGCLSNETDVLHMSALINAHAELPNQTYYTNNICCIDNDNEVAIGNSSGTVFLRLSEMTNAQVEQANESNYPYEAFISADSPEFNVSCDYRTSCLSNETCLASISNDINGHIGDCSAYTTKVCCGLATLDIYSIDSCREISSPGNYTLTANLTGAPIDFPEFSFINTTCIKITSDDVNLDCAGFNITNNGTPEVTAGIILNEVQNVTVSNCPGISQYDIGVYVRGSDLNLFSNLTLHDNNQRGMQFFQSDGNNVNDTVAHSNTLVGFSLAACLDNNLTDITAHSQERSLFVTDCNDTYVRRFHSFNATVADIGNLNGASSRKNLYLMKLILDNPLGNFENYTNLTILENAMSANSGFTLEWAPQPATPLPGGRSSFRQKFAEMTNTTGYVNFETINWHWTDAELAGYNETSLEVWKHDNGTWSREDATLLEGTNTLRISGFRPSGDYAILELNPNVSECMEINAPGNYTLAANLTGAPVSVGGIGLNNACILITSSDVALDCAGFNITNNGTSQAGGIVINGSSTAIYENITIRDCPDVSGYNNNVRVRYTRDVVVEGVTSSSNSEDGIYVEYSNDTMLLGNTARDCLSDDFPGFLIIDNLNVTVRDNALLNCFYGFYHASSPNSTVINNTAFNATNAYLIESSPDITSANNTFHGSWTGFGVGESDGFTSHNDHLYDNTYDIRLDNRDGTSPMDVYIYNMTFDNPAGNFINHTSLNITDQLNSTDDYAITWTSNSTALPPGYLSFREKFVDIGTVVGTASIDTLAFTWQDDELSGYDESLFELWKWNGTWSDTGATLNTSANTLTITDLDPESDYGILQPGLASCQAISSPGAYRLGANLTGAPISASAIPEDKTEYACIKITSSDVELDCAGHSLIHDGWTNFSIQIAAGIVAIGDITNVTVKNCANISGYDHGIWFYETDESFITNNTVFDNRYGISIMKDANYNVIEDNKVVDNTEHGLVIGQGGAGPTPSVHNNVTGNDVSGSPIYGIYITTNSHNTTVIGNTAFENHLAGIQLTSSKDCLVRDNYAYDNDYDGFDIYASFSGASNGNTIINNTAHSNGGYGFDVSIWYSNLINNTATDNGDDGFYVGWNFLNVSGSVAHGNGGAGIYPWGYLTVANSTSHSNDYGLYLASTAGTATLEDIIVFNNSIDDLHVRNYNEYNEQKFNATDILFLNPAGTMENYTTLDIHESVAVAQAFNIPTEYSISWSAEPGSPPSGRTSFEQKYVGITWLSGSVSIDRLVWSWDPAEASGYNESDLKLWKYLGGAWNTIPATLDTGAHTLTVDSLVPSSVYGILEGPGNTPPLAENVTLTSTYGTNYSEENLTASWDAYDTDDPVRNITTWVKDGSPYETLVLPFEGGSTSSSTRDYSGDSTDADVHGPTFNGSGGRDGFGAYECDGVNDYIDSNTLPSSVAGTISAWFNNPAAGQLDSYGTIIGQQNPRAYLLIRDDTEQLFWGFDGDLDTAPTSALNDSEWHMAALTYGDGSGLAKLYFDGVLVDTLTDDGDHAFIYDLFICGNDNSGSVQSDRYFRGSVDDVRVYDHSLSAEQVLALFNNRTDLIVSQETLPGGVWQACVTPNDGSQDGNQSCSGNLTILLNNTAPVVGNVTLNSTYGTNLTDEDLTVYWDSYDDDGDPVLNVTNWLRDGSSFAVLNLPFEATGGNESTWAKDYSGNGNHGTNAGLIWNATGDRDGGGAYENPTGAVASMSVADSPSLNPSDITVEAWVKPNPQTGTKVILSKGTSTRIDYDMRVYDLVPSFRFYNGAWRHVMANDTLTPGQWYHLVGTHDGSELKIYVDGVESNSTAMVQEMTDTTGALRIGSYYSGDYNFNGSIGLVRIYDGALSAEQVSSLHTRGFDRIVSQETSRDDVWQACVTPNDGTLDGNQSCSDTLAIEANTPPLAENVTLSSTYGTNYSEENLTADYDLYDDDSDPVTGIVDWRVDGASAAILNFAFDTEVDGAGSAVRDYSSRERNATLGSSYPVWQDSSSCLSGGCYLFDGDGDAIDVASADHGIGTSDLSMEAWVYPLNTGGWRSIGVFGDWTLGLYIADGYLKFHPAPNSSDTLITTGSWHHVAVTRSGGAVTYYLDGSPDGTSSDSTSAPALFRIGADGWAPDSFNGSIDGLRLYNHSLSAEQIAAIYNSGTPDYNRTVSQETSPGEVWQVCVTPNDRRDDGNESCSGNLTVLSSEPPNNPPLAENVTLTSTYGTNHSDENLTASWDSFDADDDAVYNATSWLLNSTPLTLLNMPFEANGGDESSWTKDYSGLDNHAAVGASWTASGGRDGWGAYDFSGSSYVELEDHAAFDTLESSDAVTVSLWVNPDTISASSTDEDTIMFSNQFIIRMESSDELETYIADDSNNWCRLGTTTSPMATGQWQHIVFRQNGTHIELFRNGVSLGAPVNCVGIGDQGSYDHNITLGCREQGSYDECMDGRIDDVMVFDRSLSDAQIALLFQNRTDVMHSEETSVGDLWQACVTPNDGDEDGNQSCSGTLTVLEEVISYDIDACQEISASGTYTVTADLPTSGSGACINITGDDITILCEGHLITDDGEGLGILLQDVDNVTLDNCIVRNFSIGISLDNATNISINNVSSTDNTDDNYLIDYSADVKITDSDARRGAHGGARIIRSQRVHIDPSWFCDNAVGILVNQSNDTLIEDSVACNNTQHGIYVLDSDNTTVLNSRTYNNAQDLQVDNNLGSSVALNLSSLIFDRPAGDLQDYQDMHLLDSVSPGGSFSMNWSAGAALDAGYLSFRDKYIDLSGSESIGTIVWAWTDGEAAGYNESGLIVSRYNGTNWTDTGATLDTGANTLTLSGHTPGSIYGILTNVTPVNLTEIDLTGAALSNVTRLARYNSTAAGNLSTEGGNITGTNISQTQLTDRWAAFYGGVGSNIALLDATGSNVVYSWNWTSADGGVVCLSTNSSLSTLYAMGAQGSDIDNAWSFTPSVTDSGTNTFNQTNCTVDIGPASIANASYADTGPAGGFHTCALKSASIPAKPEMLFCAEIISGGTFWNGGTGDFEVMVPAPSADGATEAYYFYMNLD